MPKRAGLRAICWSSPELVHSPSFLVTVFAFILLLGPLVVLHELGHYFAGRLFGVRADTFSIGFGKELWHRIDQRGTRWRIAAIPMGGYVQFAGDADATSRPASGDQAATPGTLAGAALWQRMIVVLAGPFANLLTAVVIIAGFAMAYGLPSNPPVIGGFAKTSAAQAAGLAVGDRITMIDGAQIASFADIAQRVMLYPGQTVQVTADRAGRVLSVPVRLGALEEKDQFGNVSRRGLLGVSNGKTVYTRIGPIDAVGFGFTQSLEITRMMAIGLKQMVLGERSLKELGGPLKMAQLSGQSLSLGWEAFVGFAALISINLAFINLLPIPTLDGGHLAFYAAEAIRRKPLGLRSQEMAFRIGMAFVLAFAVFVTVNDLAGLFH